MDYRRTVRCSDGEVVSTSIHSLRRSSFVATAAALDGCKDILAVPSADASSLVGFRSACP
jgi:hypothetical protein